MQRLLNAFLLAAAFVVWLVAGALTLRGTGAHRASSAGPGSSPTAPKVTELPDPPPPSAFDHPDQWLQALEVYSHQVEAALSDEVSREEKVVRASKLVEVASRSREGLSEQQEARLANLLQRQREILQSLVDPEGTVEQAWSAFDDGKTAEAAGLLKLLVENPNYDCPDVAMSLAYVETTNCQFDQARMRLSLVADRDDHAHENLAAFMLGWTFLQQANLQAARQAFAELLADYPNGPFSDSAQDLLNVLPRAPIHKGPQ